MQRRREDGVNKWLLCILSRVSTRYAARNLRGVLRDAAVDKERVDKGLVACVACGSPVGASGKGWPGRQTGGGRRFCEPLGQRAAALWGQIQDGRPLWQ